MRKKLHRSISIIGLTLAALFIFMACQSNAAPPAEEANVQPTTLAVAEVPASAEDQSITFEGGDNQSITDECTSCHIDKQHLIDTAKPEEEVIAENEGAG